MKKAMLVLLTLGLAGCGYSVDEVQTSAPRFTMTVPAAWDRVGNCLATYYSTGDYDTLYLPVASEKRADIIVKMIGPGIVQYRTVMFLLDVRAAGDGTAVTFRRRDLPARIDDTTRTEIARCGAAA